jgi:hypothetical protein
MTIRYLTTIILFLLCGTVFLLNFASMLLKLVLFHLLLCLLLSFLKKIKTCLFHLPFHVKSFFLFYWTDSLVLEFATDFHVTSHFHSSFFTSYSFCSFICNYKQCLRMSCHYSMFNVYRHLKSTACHHQSLAEMQLDEKKPATRSLHYKGD